jgi:hypothetical protein
MRSIKMSKETLRALVQANRDEHRNLFEEALDAFREQAIANLEARIEQIRNGGQVELYLNLEQPVDHTEDYDRVLQMLDYELDEEVTLTEQEFAQYVQDDWGWKQAFADTYFSNTGKTIR